MKKEISKVLKDKDFIQKVKTKLPKLFQIAELESSRAGKIGMEVGSLRERIVVLLFIYIFGIDKVKTEIPITEPEIDVEVYNVPISIKTISGKTTGAIKLIWTVDAEKSIEFANSYLPSCDMLLIHINWDGIGGFYYIPKEIQIEVLNKIGRENYIKLPKPGTNPRGIELNSVAVKELINNKSTLKIALEWTKEEIDFKPFDRWIELWEQE